MNPSNPETAQPQINNQLTLLSEQLARQAYPGYPEQADRFYAPAHLGYLACECLVIPDGSWSANTHPNRQDAETIPDDDTQRTLLAQGYRLDRTGRPLHPWLEQMATNQSIGIVTGKGAYWQWGPNRTADSAVVHDGSLLLIQRRDTGTWALPGGFIDGDEPAEQAAKREVGEETGVTLGSARGKQYYEGPVVDLRTTAHAWPETTAFLFQVDNDTRPAVLGADDAQQAAWVPFEELPDVRLFGAHKLLVQLALEALG